MKKILVLEDNYSSAESIKEILDDLSYRYDFANNIAAIQDLWNKNEGNYDCIIIDMMVNPFGLTNEEVNEYPRFFGWAWLRNYVLRANTKEEGEKEIKNKTIIYSKFANDFLRSEWRKERGNIKVISKKDLKSLKELKKAIQEIINK